MAFRPRDGLREPVVELGPVEEARQMVDRGVALECLHSLPRPQGNSDTGDQLVRVERLRHVIDRTRLEPQHPVRRQGAGGQEDHGRRRGVAGHHRTTELVATERRHRNVEQEQVGIVLGRKLQGLFAVLRGHNPVPGAPELQRDEHADVLVVVGDQNDRF